MNVVSLCGTRSVERLRVGGIEQDVLAQAEGADQVARHNVRIEPPIEPHGETHVLHSQ